MKPVIPIKYLLSSGLLILALSFILSHYFKLSDAADGFMKGLSIGIILLCLIKQWYAKQQVR